MLVGVVVALGLMILRFFFPFYLLYLICVSPRCACRDEARALNPSKVRGVRFWVGDSTQGCLQQSQILWGAISVNGQGNHELWECDLDQSTVCPGYVVWRVLFLRGWKDISINERTGWVQEGVQEYPVRFCIYCGVSGSQRVFYIESPSVLKQLLQI